MDTLGTTAEDDALDHQSDDGHARRSRSLRASAYIGRVGGLAIALGVGAALLGGAGIACADTGGSSSSAGASSAKSTGSASSDKSSSTAAASGRPRHARAPHSASTATSGTAATPSAASGADGSATPNRPNHEGPLSDARSTPAPTATATKASHALTSATNAQSGAAAVSASDPVRAVSDAATTATAAPPDPVRVITTAIGSLLAPLWSPSAGNTPGAPADTPVNWVMLAAARRETDGPATTPSPPAVTATNGLMTAAADSVSASAASPSPSIVVPTAQPASSTTLTGTFQQVVYSPVHTLVEAWIGSGLGQQVDSLINTLAGSYVIGNGAAGTAADPIGGAAGSLFGDGGAGWDSITAGVAGGAGGAAGILGNGGVGGSGGAGAAGGAGGAGGWVMGIGGDGGTGGAGAAGGPGGAGGTGGAATGLLFGVGGNGGDGGDGTDGGRGGDGGNGAQLLGSGGDGGAGGNSGVGGNSTGLPALGGAGGNAGFLGSHGAVGQFGTGAAVQDSTGSLMPISTTDTWLTNGAGQIVLLHGLNETYKEAPFEPSASGFSDDDAAFLAANGFNVVRLGVIWAGVEPEPGVYDTAYIKSIQKTVQTLASHGIYTVLDFHQDEYSAVYGGEGAPAWASQSGGLPNTSLSFPINEFVDPAQTHAWDAFWSNAQAPNQLGLEDDYSQMLETVAGTFNGNTDVLGYELMNEPYPGSQAVPTLLGSPFFDSEELTPFYNQAASAIRAVDPSTTIFYEPNLISSFGVAPPKLGTVDASNTVYSYHNYLPNYVPIPILEDLVPIEAQAYTQANDIPSFLTEFGATNSQSSLTAAMQPADQDLTSWTEWAYSGQGDITTAGDPNEEALVFNPELPPTGDNVNTANLTTLAEPYPQAISGTPTSFSFTNGTFQFSYSTEKADGSGSFDAGAATNISVPTVEFPNGYQVTVTGGKVVSAPNAPVLVIASDNGASTINVVVSPA
jgi:endoglycosylceramidase